MLSPKFERVKEQHPGASQLLDGVGAYIRTQAEAGRKQIIPRLAAASLKLRDGEAFVLLEMLAKGEVLRRVYNVYCRKENALLTTVDNLRDLSEVAQCDFCNTEHDPSEFRVEIAFELANSDSRDLAA